MTRDDHADDGDHGDQWPRLSRGRPALAMVGEDGNAFSILGRAKRALRLAGRADEWEAFLAEATSGDYERLLAVTVEWFDAS